MGRKVLLGIFMLVLLGLTSQTMADTTINMNPVFLYVFDSSLDNDFSVTLTGNFYSYPVGPKLQYSIGGTSSWLDWPNVNTLTINTPSGVEKIFFRVDLGNQYDSDAVVTFLGPGDPYPYFQSANLLWEFKTEPSIEIRFSTATANNLDRLSFVPLPSSALLLGTGLAGLVMVYRRRRGKKVSL